MTLSVASIQMMSTDNWQENLTFIEYQAKEAALSGAHLVVLPENAILFSGKSLRNLAESDKQKSF